MQMTNEIRFLEGNDFTLSLRTLHQKGGAFQNAAKTVRSVWGRAHARDEFKLVFEGVPRTNHGEDRIPHCIKYDLTRYSRLVTVVNNGICIFLFCGDHDTVDRWLEKNRGLDFVAKEAGDRFVIDKVRSSDPHLGVEGRITAPTDLSVGPLIDLMPERYRDRILQGLADDIVKHVLTIESISSDDQIEDVSTLCGPQVQQLAMMDVLLSLKSGDVINAKLLIDLFAGRATPVVDLQPQQVAKIQSSESAVLVSDMDPVLFQHFIETASFEQWMLYLHPSQREYVAKDYSGPAKLAGVSGSGKTCVVVHRALRLADLYVGEPILIVTLSAALASLISRLIDAARGDQRPKNLKVMSIFDLCYEKLLELEPQKKDYYTKRTIAKNPHAISEHIDDIWNEYFLCENNNLDADKMFDVVQTLSVRGVFSSDYLRQEIDYIRSGFRPGYRHDYLKMVREGRVVPLEERYRLAVLDGLDGWEKKMQDVGAVDDMGIVTALSKHIEVLKPIYRCVLVDEVQDLGTLELSIIRKLTKAGTNDLFLSGDAAQTIYTKSSELKDADIDVADRSANLKQNYRNSRQILTSAHAVLTRSLETIPKCALHLEVLPPEYASFSSPNPLLLKAESILEELSYAISYLKDLGTTANQNQRFCIAICGYSQAAVEILGVKLTIPVLSSTSDISSSRLFMSDLEQTKGFEFDVVVVINCTSAVMPHPILPDEESFRDLSRLYVAMTRAKTQLLVSYHGTPSKFIEAARDTFTEGQFLEHTELTDVLTVDFPAPSIPELKNPDVWNHSAIPFLKSRDAVGLSRSVQDAILSRVTGTDLLRGSRHKQMEWKSLGSFISSMQNPNTRYQVISPEAWQALNAHLGG
jgi:AAA domain/UvrD-like helicase C-terminal domain